LGPISSERALDLLLKQIDQARHGGAKVVLGGHRIDRPGFYIEPTILTGIDKGNPVCVLKTSSRFYLALESAKLAR
jgi:succinate-semialdehyde dehydrogenase/glutarate-semialdehyde dehydrogenase